VSNRQVSLKAVLHNWQAFADGTLGATKSPQGRRCLNSIKQLLNGSDWSYFGICDQRQLRAL
jgi:hypothetical protein